MKTALVLASALLITGCKFDHKGQDDEPKLRTHAEQAKPQTYTRGGYVREHGYEVLVSSIRSTDGYTQESGKTNGLAFATKAPDDKSFALSCIALNKRGELIGGGGSGVLRRNAGSEIKMLFLSFEPSTVKCRVVR